MRGVGGAFLGCDDVGSELRWWRYVPSDARLDEAAEIHLIAIGARR